MDISGDHQLDVDHNIFKKRLSPTGLPLATSATRHECMNSSSNFTDLDSTWRWLSEDSGRKRSRTFTTQLLWQLLWCRTYSRYSCTAINTDCCFSGYCCNTCEQVQEVYRKKGWAFTNAEHIEQCVREGWSQKMQEQMGEGCQVYGYLLVNKVSVSLAFW